MASTSPDIEELVAPYLTLRSVIVRPISTLSVMFLVYGMYIMIFGRSIRVLTRLDNASKLYLGWTISLFLLATLLVCCQTISIVQATVIEFNAVKSRDYIPFFNFAGGGSQHHVLGTSLVALSNLTMLFMNLVSDWMLIHRCYIIWNRNKFVVYPLALVAFVINGILFGTTVAATMGFDRGNTRLIQRATDINNGTWIAAAGFNSVLTLMTGGRIWWISREVRQMMGESFKTRYAQIVAIVFESGFLYSSTLLISIIFRAVLDPHSHETIPIDLEVISTQMAGIAPTLIIVRALHGKAVESVNQVVSNMEFAPRPKSTVQATVDLHPAADSNAEVAKV